MLKRAKKYYSNSEFTRNVVTLMTGTTIAQAIPIAISPILTRIYTPDDFGVLALFMAITAITGAISNAKYEQAIILPKNNNNSINILVLGIAISFLFSLFLLIIVVIFDEKIAILLGNIKIKNWLYFVPISTLFLGIFNSLNFYNIRHKKFKNIAKSQVTKSTSLAITQIGIGFFKNGPFGLILGQIMSYLSGNYMLFKTLKNTENYKKVINNNDIKKLSKKYKKFPFFSLPSVFLNVINLNLMNILISSFFSVTTLGFFSLTQRIIGIPSRVIGNSLSQVYFQKATQEYHNTGKTYRVFIKTLKKLVIIGFPIFLILFFIAEPTFAFVFGEKWRIAGTYAKILVPFAFIRFVSSSLSNTIDVHQVQQVGLIINLILLLTVIISFYFAKIFNISFIHLLLFYSVILSIEYIIFIYLYFIISKSKK